MSSPVHDDGDKRAMYVPPWARDQRHAEETRRLHEEIVEAAERLRERAPQAPPKAPPNPNFQTRYAGDGAGNRVAPPPPTEPFAIEAAVRDAFYSSSLDPVPVPPPPREGGPSWGMVSRLAGAFGFAALVAAFVTGAIQVPAINISVGRDSNEANAVAPFVAAGRENPRQPAAPAAVNAAFQPPPVAVPAAPPVAPPAAPTVGVAAIAPPPPPAQLPAWPQPKAQQPEIQKRPAAAGPDPVSAVPEPRVLDFLSQDQIASLLKRGQDLIATGDIAGARLVLLRAAEVGDARGSLALAGTYDAAALTKLGVIGVAPDPVKARTWYMKAAEQGSTEAARALEQMAAR